MFLSVEFFIGLSNTYRLAITLMVRAQRLAFSRAADGDQERLEHMIARKIGPISLDAKRRRLQRNVGRVFSRELTIQGGIVVTGVVQAIVRKMPDFRQIFFPAVILRPRYLRRVPANAIQIQRQQSERFLALALTPQLDEETSQSARRWYDRQPNQR